MADGPGEPFERFDVFVSLLADHLDVEVEDPAPTALLTDVLDWDSLRVLEVVAWLEDAGVWLPDEVVGELRTLGDLHHYAHTIGSRHEPGPTTPRVPLIGRHVHLEPFGPQHQGPAYDMLTRPPALTEYRLRGMTPGPDGLQRVLWDRVLAQFAVVTGRSMVGVVTALEADLRNGHVHVAAITAPDAPAGTGAEAMLLLLEHLFDEFAIRKVYAEVLAPNLATFSSGAGRIFDVEGRLTGHEYLHGTYHDMVILALTRERWEERGRPLLPAVVNQSRHDPPPR